MLNRIAGPAVLLLCLGALAASAQDSTMTYNELSSAEERVIIDKGTEPPFSGKYLQFDGKGVYTCRRCDTKLYRSADKFDSHCGWPSFDDEITGAIKRVPDADGRRTEITCAVCGAHLGHVFNGEGLTAKNIRHCVNSISLVFIPQSEDSATQTAYFAGGCFWGVEYYLQNATGVISTRVGYMGGHTSQPEYADVCGGITGHAEVVEVVFNPDSTSFEILARLFFEIHDPTQVNRQGPDIGEQYRSIIFFADETQKQTAEKLIKILEEKGHKIATTLVKAETFWAGEEYHQDYYIKTGKQPYCHGYVERF